MATFTVITTADNGNNANPLNGSLRQGLIKANQGLYSTITFPFTNPNTTIDYKLSADLPNLTASGVTITAQNTSNVTIELDRQNQANGVGLEIKGDNDLIQDLMIANCNGIGIAVYGNNDSIGQCEIGTDRNDDPGFGNGIGVYVFHGEGLVIGLSMVDDNESDGLQIFQSDGVQVLGNEFEHNLNGVHVIGEAANLTQPHVTVMDGNTMDENFVYGIYIDGSSHNLIGNGDPNFIGDDGEPAEHIANTEGNLSDGIRIESAFGSSSFDNEVQGNFIAGNRGNGVALDDAGTYNNTVIDNWIGITKLSGDGGSSTEVPSGNKQNGVAIFAGAHNNVVGGKGLFLDGKANDGAGNYIVANSDSGVWISDADTQLNVVQGNLIGFWVNGGATEANEADGVTIISGAHDNVIGGLGGTAPVTGSGNLIANNFRYGVNITGAGTNSNLVTGNRIGTDSTGTKPLPNVIGVLIADGASNNRVGFSLKTTGLTLGNLISGNEVDGVDISGAGTNGNFVQSNQIGTDISGTNALPNGTFGVAVHGGATNTSIGGANDTANFKLLGNIISGNVESGILLSDNGTTGNQVAGNLIGTDVTGTLPLANSGDGVIVTLSATGNLIGGASGAYGNVISANSMAGLVINSLADGTTVTNNLIGTTSDGQSALGNGHDGVDLQTNNNVLFDNVISANQGYGVLINGTSNLLQRDRIGTDQAGDAALANSLDGVSINVTNGSGPNTLGGATSGFGNLISGNKGNGIRIVGGTSANNLIEGNRIGSDLTGKSVIANQLNGILIQNSFGNSIGGSTGHAGNLISGNFDDGIAIVGAGSTGNLVLGNRIGTDVGGLFGIANALNGVEIEGASQNIIGGVAAGDGNLISDNFGDGVLIHGVGSAINVDSSTEANQVLGNTIGTDLAGNGSLGNLGQGVEISLAFSNSIGGDIAGAKNLISGNQNDGILLTNGATTNLVQGNFIGTNAIGTKAVPNGGNGIELSLGANRNIIGGVVTATSTPANLISGNNLAGTLLRDAGTTLNRVQSNDIGTTRDGLAALGNTLDGIEIAVGASNNQIGGSAGKGVPATGNIVSGNGRDGIRIFGAATAGNVIQANQIGGYPSGLTGHGNNGNGVYVLLGASQNIIGGPLATDGNTIAYNKKSGVVIGLTAFDSNTVANMILFNSIYSNVGLGIDLGNDGVTQNPVGNPPPGPNKFEKTPVIKSAQSNGITTAIQLQLSGAPSATYIIQLFSNTKPDPSGYGEGQNLVASVTVMTDTFGNIVNGLVTVSGDLSGLYLTATATDQAGDTSEFSLDYLVP